jgi:beta-1,4-mannosyltransferase
MLSSSWLAEHASHFDVFHIHFRSEQQSMTGLRAWMPAVAAAGKPLAFTVHDLQNPLIAK